MSDSQFEIIIIIIVGVILSIAVSVLFKAMTMVSLEWEPSYQEILMDYSK